jgi:hypothetical protein
MSSNANELLSKVQAIFAYANAELGYPYAPTKRGFLALARGGRDVWNAWRARWPELEVDFRDVDFANQPIDFGGFQFTPRPLNEKIEFTNPNVDFSGARFGLKTNFSGARFGTGNNFSGTHFAAAANFSGARFASWARFKGANFDRDTNFSGAHFGDEVDFTGAQFGVGANFSGANFGDGTGFGGAQFDSGARFDNTRFGDWTSFRDACFEGEATFTGAEFGVEMSFEDARLGTLARFNGVQFGDRATFNGAQFGDAVRFRGAQFGSEAGFGDVQFGAGANFSGAQFGDEAYFDGSCFGDDTNFSSWDTRRIEGLWRAVCIEEDGYDRRRKFADQLDLRSDGFKSIAFRGARFTGRVSFQNREFLGRTDFGPVRADANLPTQKRRKVPLGERTRFEGIPDFHGCKLHQNTSFDGAQFLVRTTPEAARAYRTLKLAMAQQQATREEQRFFRLEMASEGALARDPRSYLFRLYAMSSDYGFSLTRPFALWLSCLIIFAAVHGALVGADGPRMEVDWQRTMQWVQYVLFNAIPLPGFDKAQLALREKLFSPDAGTMLAVIVFDMLHKSCALIAVFLAGLALRNLFKMKG